MKIEISGIFTDDVFKWFCQHVLDSCGDGTGFLVCSNYKEAAQYFKEWDIKNSNHLKYLETDEFPGQIIIHDMNESFTFSDHLPGDMFYGDYTFIIKEDTAGTQKLRKYNE